MDRIKKMLSKPLIIAISTRLYLFIVAWLAVMYLPFRERVGFPSFRALPQYPFLDAWTRWDGGWYVSIATNGYQFSQNTQSNVAFFPLYPLTIRLFMSVFKNPFISGIIVSNLAFIIGIALFYKLLREYLLKDEGKTSWSILFLISFPYSLFFSAVYSESLFLMCVVLCFYFAERKNWFLSGISGMLACADRFVGVALFPAIIVKYWETYTKSPCLTAPSLIKGRLKGGISPLCIGLIPLGLVGYMLFLYTKFGDPLAFAHTITAGWAGMKTLHPDVLLPFKSFINTIINFNNLPDNKYHVLFQFPIFVFFLIILYFVYKYLGTAYALFSLIMLLIPASVSKDLIAMGRYMLVIFPVFVVIPLVIKNNYIRFVLFAFSFFFLTLFTAMFSTWWWVG